MLKAIKENLWCLPILNLSAYVQIRAPIIVDKHPILVSIVGEIFAVFGTKNTPIIYSIKSKNPAKNISIIFLKWPSTEPIYFIL